jgi:hypothetical protein
MNNFYELKKLCLAYTGVDLELREKLKNQHRHKEVAKTLKRISESYPNHLEAEQALVKEIQALIGNSRKLELMGLLLEEGFEQGVLSGKAYDAIRTELGVTEYDDETKERVHGKWSREYTEDQFSLLSGPEPKSSLPQSTETF